MPVAGEQEDEAPEDPLDDPEEWCGEASNQALVSICPAAGALHDQTPLPHGTNWIGQMVLQI